MTESKVVKQFTRHVSANGLKFRCICLIKKCNAARVGWNIFQPALWMREHAGERIGCDRLIHLQAAELGKYFGAMNEFIGKRFSKRCQVQQQQ